MTSSVSSGSGAPAEDVATAIVGFISQLGSAGRTSAAANVAWILASAGYRVLVMDRSTETPGVDDFLSPFIIDTVHPREVLGPGSALALFTGDVVRRYRLPTTTDQIDVLGPADLAIRSRAESPGTDGFGEAATIRETLRAAGYDIVLVDSPVDLSDVSATRAALLYDAVAVCFLPRRRAVERAAELAYRIHHRAPVRMRMVAVATDFDDRDELRAHQVRIFIDETFGELRVTSQAKNRDLFGEVVEIPRQPYYAYDEVLTVLMEQPVQASPLLTGYERLATAVLGRPVALKPVSSDVLERYRRGFGLGHEDADPETIYLLCALRDRPWADWITGLLETAGARVRKLPCEIDLRNLTRTVRVLVIASPHLSGSTVANLTAIVEESGPDYADKITVVRADVEDNDVDLPLDAQSTVDVAACAEEEARTELLSQLGMIPRAIGEQAVIHNFPGGSRTPQGMASLPPRNPVFAGRDDELDAMRDYFLGGGGVRQWALVGTAGIGKSEIALEYAHRFGFDYGIVWWISARSPQSIQAGLGRLAGELKVGVAGNAAAAALATLSRGPRSTRWLLVYDDAEDLRVLDGHVPGSGFGDVIVTTRAKESWSTEAGAQVTRLEPTAGNALLRTAVSGLTTQDAAGVAAAVEHVPLALRLAGAWLLAATVRLRQRGFTVAESAAWAAAEFQDLLGQVEGDVLDGPGGPVVPPSVSRVLSVMLDTLKQDRLGRLAVRLVELCAFLSPDSVALRLLRSAPMMAELAEAGGVDAVPLMQDAFQLDPVLALAARSGLCDVAWGSAAALRMHSVMQQLLHHRMHAENTWSERQGQILRGLAAVAPFDSEEDDSGRLIEFVELQRHLGPSGALDSSDRAVRRWVSDQIWWLYTQRDAGAWQSAVDLAEKALQHWQPATADSDLRSRLMFNLADLHRGLGRYGKALELNEVVLTEQRRDLGLTALRTLRTARGKAGDLRLLGRFDEALAEDQSVWQGFRETLGDDHPETLKATNNLSLSLFLTGDVRGALALEEGNKKRRLMLFGPEHSSVLWSACNIATYLCELGDLDQAANILQDALIHIRESVPPNHPDELRIRRSLAVTLRRQGRAAAAKERDGETLQAYRELFGEEHPTTRACALSLAADCHAIGDATTAITLATHCLEGYLAGVGPQHPFTNLCRVNLGLFFRVGGRLGEAEEAGSLAVATLQTQLGETHPWSLAAAINHALTLIVRGDARATDSLRVTYDECREFLGVGHPYSRAAARYVERLRRVPEVSAADDIGLGGLEIDVLRG